MELAKQKISLRKPSQETKLTLRKPPHKYRLKTSRDMRTQCTSLIPEPRI